MTNLTSIQDAIKILDAAQWELSSKLNWLDYQFYFSVLRNAKEHLKRQEDVFTRQYLPDWMDELDEL